MRLAQRLSVLSPFRTKRIKVNGFSIAKVPPAKVPQPTFRPHLWKWVCKVEFQQSEFVDDMKPMRDDLFSGGRTKCTCANLPYPYR